MLRSAALFVGLVLAAGTAACQEQASPLPLSADSAAVLRNAPLAPAAMQADLDLLDQAFRTLHPGLFRYTTATQWTARVDSLRTYLGQPRTRGEAFLAFSKLAASVRCGHTYLNFWNQPSATLRWLTDAADKLPFEYALTPDDRWVVTRIDSRAAPGLQVGDTINAVQGVPTPAIIMQLLAYMRADGGNDGKRRALLDFRHGKQYEAIDVFLPLMLPPTAEQYTVTVQHRGDAEPRVLTLLAITAAERRARALPAPGLRERFDVVVHGRIATLRVDGFEEGGGWARFVPETFKMLKAQGVTQLIVDLRKNEGGSDEGAALLLRYLIRTPIILPPLRRYVVYQTVPTALRPVLDTWDQRFYDRRNSTTPHGDGTYDLRSNEAWPAVMPVAEDAFRSNIVILTSSVNSSASHLLLRLLQRRPGITLVGEPTGGSQRAHTGGNLFFAQLAGTGMEVDLPLIAYDWGAEQPEGGVAPDVRVPADEALQVALGLLSQT